MDHVLTADGQSTGAVRKESNGSVTVTDEVVASIAGRAAAGVEGVEGLSKTLADGVAGLLGKNEMAKGVHISITDKDVTIDINVIVAYSKPLIEIAHNVQSAVKSAVESMTGMNVLSVNVDIQSMRLPETA